MQQTNQPVSTYRFTSQHKGIKIHQYKIVDQNQKQFKCLDNEQFQGVGLCSVICLSVIQTLTDQKEQNSFQIKQILSKLRDAEIINTNCKKVTKRLKQLRRGYIKTHRYEFGKDQKAMKRYLNATTNDMEILNYLKQQIANSHRVFYTPKVTIEGEDLPQYIQDIKNKFEHEKVWIIGQSNNQKQKFIGIFKNQQDHYVSFIVQDKEFHLFNSLDQPSYKDDGIKLIIDQLFWKQSNNLTKLE